MRELAASRARIITTADATRRRIERDLHDGAQQQLVSLALELRAAQTALPSELNEQRAELSRVVEGLKAVLDELREISSGIHPAILSEGGLAPAMKTLARRSPIPVRSMSVSKVGYPRAWRSLPTTSSRKCSRTQRSTHVRRASAWTWREPTECCVSRSGTTAWAAPIPRAARGLSGCVTASRPWAGRSRSKAQGMRGPRSRSLFHLTEMLSQLTGNRRRPLRRRAQPSRSTG